ncbi:hypothetical protein [Kribbella antiqua]|uniref:hypothetical protein n=1 Tax=Kribbella antiqua TaxID=2512217 RepID=UPI0010503237|nr:hypothetical protein [Kribbella antiqua]
MLLTSDNIREEFLRTFPQAAAALEADDGADPAGRVDWVFRHDVMPHAIGDPAALRDVFAWIERLLQSSDSMIEYWTAVRLLGRTLDWPEWVPLVEEHAGPLLATAMSR